MTGVVQKVVQKSSSRGLHPRSYRGPYPSGWPLSDQLTPRYKWNKPIRNRILNRIMYNGSGASLVDLYHQIGGPNLDPNLSKRRSKLIPFGSDIGPLSGGSRIGYWDLGSVAGRFNVVEQDPRRETTALPIRGAQMGSRLGSLGRSVGRWGEVEGLDRPWSGSPALYLLTRARDTQ